MLRQMMYALFAVVLSLSAGVRAADSAKAATDEKIALEQCPAPVQAALNKAATDGLLKKVRRVTRGDAVAYVGVVEVTLDSKGNRIEPIAAVDGVAAEAAAAAAAAAALAKPVTLKVTATPLREVCVTLSEAAGVPVSCGNAFASRLVTVALEGKPFGEVLNAVAEQTGTRAEAREGGYRFRTGAR